MTTIPQKSRNRIKIISDSNENIKGETRQQAADKASRMKAILLFPKLSATYPPITQDTLPIPIIKKDSKGVLMAAFG